MITLRCADHRDTTFLEDMLVEAINWDPPKPRLTRDEVLCHAENRHYVDGWPRETEFGFVAEDSEMRPVGAAWLCFFSQHDPGYGFIAEDIPELSIAVVRHRRAQGVGGRLLRALADEARGRGLHALSLSVEPTNPARRLYERHGFREVGGSGGSATLRLDLA